MTGSELFLISILVSEGAGKPVFPENGSELVNLDWLLESILQSKYCKTKDFPTLLPTFLIL